jgi:hypothetical protein
MPRKQQSMVEQTRTLLLKRRKVESRAAIAENSGVNKHWLEKFDQGVLQNPTLKNIEALHAYLSRAEKVAA